MAQPTTGIGTQYLAYDDKAEQWSVMTITQIKEAFEHAYYSNEGRPDAFWALDRPSKHATGAHDDHQAGPTIEPTPLAVHRVGITCNDNEWMYSDYELRDIAARVYSSFTTRTDGRA